MIIILNENSLAYYTIINLQLHETFMTSPLSSSAIDRMHRSSLKSGAYLHSSEIPSHTFS